MRILLDTNILIRAASPFDPLRDVGRAATDVLIARGNDLCAVPQNFYEFYVVATRPKSQNGLGLPSETAHSKLREFESMWVLMPDSSAVYTKWRELVREFKVLGKSAHDARLVAAMMVHGVGTILTFNVDDFRRFPGLSVMEPSAVAAE